MGKKKFYETEQFQKLHKDWETKLKTKIDNDEFEDIVEVEREEQPQIFNRENKQYYGGLDYYQLCHQILREFKFKKPLHKIIFEFHTEGMPERKIEKKIEYKMSQRGIGKLIERIRTEFVYGKKQ